MYLDSILFLAGFGCGVAATLAITFLVALAYSRIARLPSPTGMIHQPEPLPFVLNNDHAEAKVEREYFGNDQVPGLGR